MSDLAERSGCDPSWLRALGSGDAWCFRYRDIASLASALQVDVAEMTGRQYPTVDQPHAVVHASGFALRRVLTTGRVPFTTPLPNVSLEVLRGADGRGDDQGLVEALPQLVARASDLNSADADEVAGIASDLMRRLGYLDLAWIVLGLRGADSSAAVRALARARLLLDLGAYPEAVRTIAAVGVGPDPAPAVALIVAFGQAGDAEECARSIAEARNRFADDNHARGLIEVAAAASALELDRADRAYAGVVEARAAVRGGPREIESLHVLARKEPRLTATDTFPAAEAGKRLLARIAQEMGGPAALAGQLSGSILNVVHAVRCGGRDLIAKYGAPDGIRREAAVLTTLALTEVPVPHAVLLPATPEFPHDLLLLDLLPGQPAAPDSEVLTDAGRSLRRLHDLHVPGFGLVGVGPHGLTGTSDTWAGVLGTVLTDARQAIPPDVVPAAVHDEAAAQLRQPHIHTHLAGIEQGVLLHGDLMPKHVWDDHGCFAGLIDWGDAMVGDPLFDLARVSMAGPKALDTVREGYGGSSLDEHILAFYRMVWSLTALAAECRAGGDWVDGYLATVRRELDLMPSS